MSDKSPNGNGHTTIVNAGVKLGSQLVNSIGPPQFIVLIVLNVILLGFLYWFVSARAEHTADILNQLMSTCLREKGQ